MIWERLTVARQHVFGQKRAVWRVLRRCLHENKRSHTFKSGEVMWVCDCGAGGGHYDQSTPIEGKLYRKGGVVAEEIDTDGAEQTQEEIAELSVPTFSWSPHFKMRRCPRLIWSRTAARKLKRRNVSKSYDDEMAEIEFDKALKASIARGDSEQKQNAIIDAFTEPKPAPDGVAL